MLNSVKIPKLRVDGKQIKVESILLLVLAELSQEEVLIY